MSVSYGSQLQNAGVWQTVHSHPSLSFLYEVKVTVVKIENQCMWVAVL